MPLSPSSIIWYRPTGGDALRLPAGKVTTGLAESNGSLPPGGWLQVTCGLTACIQGSAPVPTVGNKYGRTLPLPYRINVQSVGDGVERQIKVGLHRRQVEIHVATVNSSHCSPFSILSAEFLPLIRTLPTYSIASIACRFNNVLQDYSRTGFDVSGQVFLA